MLTVLALSYLALLLVAPAMRFRVVAAALATIALVEGWSLLGVSFASLGALEALPLALFGACAVADLRGYARRRSRRHLLTLLGVSAFLLVLAAWAFGTSALLPTHDPSAVPTFARLIRDHGRVPETQAPIDARVWYYPPGFAILLACFSWITPLATLWFFKGAAIAVLAFTPVAWAVTLRRIVTQRVSLVSATAAAAFGFVLFDRTLVLAPAFAGKNSQLLASALAPIALELILARRHALKGLPLSIAVAAGLVLIHFSMLYVLAALMVLWALTRRRLRPVFLATLGLPLFAAALLSLPRMLAALREHPDVRPVRTPLLEAAWSLVHALTARRSPGLFIFEDLDIAWPHKGVVLLAIGFIAGAVVAVARRKALRRLGFVTLMACLAVIGLLAIYTGTLPMPLSPDFTRWFLYNFSALAAGSAFLLLLRGLPTARGDGRWSAVAAACVAGCMLLEVCLAKWGHQRTDLGVLASTSREQRFSSREVSRVAQQLAGLSDQPCALVTSGTPSIGGRVVQDYKPFEYVKAFSNCYLANGSWLSLGSGLEPGCDGVASETCARAVLRLHPTDSVYLVAPSDTMSEWPAGAAPLGPYFVRRIR